MFKCISRESSILPCGMPPVRAYGKPCGNRGECMTIEEAKKIYLQYDCSLFAMAREDIIAHDNFRALKTFPKKYRMASGKNYLISCQMK